MKNKSKDRYGNEWAEVYDEYVSRHQSIPEVAETVEFLVSYAAGGPILELGVGLGRVALPLAARGLEVHGIEASSEMISRLRAKPGGDQIILLKGDFTECQTTDRYTLIYVVYNTFFWLTDQASQVLCFQNIADRLLPGGAFIIEVQVPDPVLYREDSRVQVMGVNDTGWEVRFSSHDPVQQRIHSKHVWFTEGGQQVRDVLIRYAWPAEMDLMALLAGLDLDERFGGWSRQPFTGASRTHVSIYRKRLGSKEPC